MYTIISPSKTQDFSQNFPKGEGLGHISQYNKQTKQLAAVMKRLSVGDIEEIMHVSQNIGVLNYERFQKWEGLYKKREIDENGDYSFSPAIYAFRGDVYRGFDLEAYGKNDFSYAEDHLGIISGFYGLLTPLTYMQPYRLEMGTKMSFEIGKKEYDSLYAFWRTLLTERLNEILTKEKVLLNLASVEYAKVVDRKSIDGEVVDVDFKVKKYGKVRTVAIYAKRARGLMANWIVQNRVNTVVEIQNFNSDGWKFAKSASTTDKIVFIKRLS